MSILTPHRERIRPGDRVLAQDEATGQTEAQDVQSTIHHPAKLVYALLDRIPINGRMCFTKNDKQKALHLSVPKFA